MNRRLYLCEVKSNMIIDNSENGDATIMQPKKINTLYYEK